MNFFGWQPIFIMRSKHTLKIVVISVQGVALLVSISFPHDQSMNYHFLFRYSLEQNLKMGMSSTIIKHWQHDMPPGGKPVAQFSAAALEPEQT